MNGIISFVLTVFIAVLFSPQARVPSVCLSPLLKRGMSILQFGRMKYYLQSQMCIPPARGTPQSGLLAYPAYGAATEAQKEDLKQMDAFFNGIWLEYAAYAAFKEVLEKVKRDSGGRRDNFELRHNVYVRQKGPGPADRHFELDVVAALGYQVVVISCSTTSSISTVKQKAMEAYHRARQLGGAEARAVVLCLASYEDAERVEKELEDETGTERPLQIWGRQKGERSRRYRQRPAMPGNIPNMDSLRDKFRKLLFDGYDNADNSQHLHWK